APAAGAGCGRLSSFGSSSTLCLGRRACQGWKTPPSPGSRIWVASPPGSCCSISPPAASRMSTHKRLCAVLIAQELSYSRPCCLQRECPACGERGNSNEMVDRTCVRSAAWQRRFGERRGQRPFRRQGRPGRGQRQERRRRGHRQRAAPKRRKLAKVEGED